MPASLVFVNGAVFTADAARSWCRAVAVERGRIVAVGSDSEISEHIGPVTDVVDLGGRLLVPGFQDAHCHPVTSGLELLGLAMLGIETRSESLDAIAAYVASQPDKEWILGGGWSMGAFPGGTPLREDLDAIVPDRPVFLTNRDGHGAWVNSRPRDRRCGRSDPRPARRPDRAAPRRQPVGHPTRRGNGAGPASSAPTTESEWRAALEAGQRYMLDLGNHRMAGRIGRERRGGCLPMGRSQRETESAGRRLFVVGAGPWSRADRRVDGEAGSHRSFSPTTVKLMLDGVAEFHRLDARAISRRGRPAIERRGIDFIDPDRLGAFVAALDAAGFQCHFHAIGDRAVRNALDAVAAARRANGWNDLRHVAHIQVIHSDDLARFRRLGVAANAQPLWAQHEEYQRDLTIPFLGEPRWR